MKIVISPAVGQAVAVYIVMVYISMFLISRNFEKNGKIGFLSNFVSAALAMVWPMSLVVLSILWGCKKSNSR